MKNLINDDIQRDNIKLTLSLKSNEVELSACRKMCL